MELGDSDSHDASPRPQLILASASPRRRQLLGQIGIRFRAIAVDIDEKRGVAEPAEAYVQRLAVSKAQTAAVRVGNALAILGADTAVVLDGRILGKPANRLEGVSMLAALSDREHKVMTALALISGAKVLRRLSVSRVRFRTMARSELEAYWDTGECVDKAGAYAIQGKGALFVSHLEGSYSGVMGLPLFELGELLTCIGVKLLAHSDVS